MKIHMDSSVRRGPADAHRSALTRPAGTSGEGVNVGQMFGVFNIARRFGNS